ncbi:hypothetical protein [Staphylococcus warneri]|uniref:hypothetical protein n=1 Tax=Staphylococcus warneri TaxID=1292 RepID=UPI00164398FB|nr:hypothetical protein [Staphylococcus warneri]
MSVKIICGREGIKGCGILILGVVVNGKNSRREIRIDGMEIGIKIKNGGLAGR